MSASLRLIARMAGVLVLAGVSGPGRADTFLVESRPGGQHPDYYHEEGEFQNSSAKSTAPGCTAGLGSRYATVPFSGRSAVYSFTPMATGFYEVFVTWGMSPHGYTKVAHTVTHDVVPPTIREPLIAGRSAEVDALSGGLASLPGFSTTVVLNQNSAAGLVNRWNLLGSFFLFAGVTYTVEQTVTDPSGTGNRLMADAVLWRMLCPCPPTIIGADSRRVHGLAGEFDVALSLVEPGAAVECRTGGPLRFVLTFSNCMQPADGVLDDEVTVSSGELLTLELDQNVLIATMPDPPEAECLTIAVAGLVDWEGMPLTGVRQITFRRLEGDVSGDGRVSIFDLLAVRNNLGQPVTAANFRCDLDADGSVNLADLLAVRNRLHRTAPCAASRSRGGRVST